MVRTRIALGVAVMTAAAGVACGEDEGPSLLVDVRTDLRPGDEFAAVEVELRGAGTDRRASAPALTGHDFVAGRRVAELGGLAPGDVTVHVALIDATGASVAQRSTEIVLREDTGITVVISRDCVDVRCPGPGDAPTHTQCHGGRCVDPRCHAGDFGACGAVECVSDAVCAEAADACGAAVCAAGACLFGPNEACVPDAGPADAGGRDASTICTGDVDCPEAEECGAMGRCVTSCAESRVDPYAGTPCTSATFECILMCSGQACIDACVDADAMGSECVSCIQTNAASCYNSNGCQSRWNCYIECVRVNCGGMTSDACAEASCRGAYDAWVACTADVESRAPGCGPATEACVP